MKLIDSNLVIYSYQQPYIYLRPLVSNRANYISAISRLEVVDFHSLAQQEQTYFELVFSVLVNLPINDDVINKAIQLRQQYKMKSNDSLIAATGLLYNLDLYTRNTSDFEPITGLNVFNPVL